MRSRRSIVDPEKVKLRCVIVDDSPLFLESAADLLTREGLDVVGVASSGDEAVRLVAALTPDVTLVDVDLGEEDGFQVAQRLHAIPGSGKVILVSTHAEVDLAQLIDRSPALGFISKTRLSARAILETLARAA
jgi:DNA-binding NarL/FixJ family response regulator